MVAYKDSWQEEEPLIPNMQEEDMGGEGEDTLSLCDLPTSTDAFDWKDFHKSSSSSSDQDYFEFSSEEWSTVTAATRACSFPPDNVVFCGKIIPYKKSASENTHAIGGNDKAKRKERSLCRWNSDPLCKPKSTSSTPNEKTFRKEGIPSSKSLPEKCGHKNDVFVPRVSSRWYFLLFGLARVPTKMEMRDMRKRQSRRGPLMMFRSDGGGGEVVGACRSSFKGWWRLIRALGCGGDYHNANATVPASFSCAPRA